MNDRRIPTLSKWPFYVADLVLISLAIWIFSHYPHPLHYWPATLMVACVAGAAFLGVLPHRLEYRTAAAMADSESLTTAVNEIDNLEAVAEQIKLATSQWQAAQELSTRSVSAAGEIAERITAEAQSFSEFLQKANDSDRANLRLENEKLRRAEGQWLQVLVGLLDHVFALYQAAARSGQPRLQDQMGHFQDACRDLARRVGLTPFEAVPGEGFDAERHQLHEDATPNTPDARIGQTLATGYTFQGQLLRKPLVALAPAEAGKTVASFPSGTSAGPTSPRVSAEPPAAADTLSQPESTIEADPSGPDTPASEASESFPEEFRLESQRLTPRPDPGERRPQP